MSQIDVTKLVGYVDLDWPDDAVSMAKLVGYVDLDVAGPELQLAKLVGYVDLDASPGPTARTRCWVMFIG